MSPTNLLDYVNVFRRRRLLACKQACENLTKAQNKMKDWFESRALHSEFSPGDQVLTLISILASPFLAKFSGPYVVMRKVSDLYVISTPDRKNTTQLCHVSST